MTPSNILSVRRLPLSEVVATLPGDALRLLFHLGGRACSRTYRVWTTPLRASEELGLSAVQIEAHLDTLVAQRHLLPWSRGVAALRCYELGPLFVRAAEAPENLPVAPEP